MNFCRSCRQDFSSIRAFDVHRVGRHDYSFREGLEREPSVEDGRRCLDPDELCERGLELDARGRWALREHAERGRALGATRAGVR